MNNDELIDAIVATKADIDKAAKTVRRERMIIRILVAVAVALGVVTMAIALLSPRDQQASYFDLADERYGMSQDTAQQVADMWCDSHGNPDPDALAALIHQGTDNAGFDRLASSKSELVLLTLAAEQAYCPK